MKELNNTISPVVEWCFSVMPTTAAWSVNPINVIWLQVGSGFPRRPAAVILRRWRSNIHVIKDGVTGVDDMGKGGNGSRVSQPVTEWYKNRHLIMWIWGIFAIVGFLGCWYGSWCNNRWLFWISQ